MSHTCDVCGMACDCDLEDHDQPAPDDCTHCEDGEDWEDDFFWEDEL